MQKKLFATTLGALALSLSLGASASFACEKHAGKTETAPAAASEARSDKAADAKGKKVAKRAAKKADAARAEAK